MNKTLSLVVLLAAATACAVEPPRVLVFSKTGGFRHQSIPDGIRAIRQLGEEAGFEVEATEDAGSFNDEGLGRFDAVLFLSTTGDVLDDEQQAALERFIRAGGGFVGVHAAADTEYDWPWYGELVGARFVRHPAIQEATLRIEDDDHAATRHLEPTWTRTDEWYDFRDIQPQLNLLLTIDETSYEGASTGDPHPMSWDRLFDGGRSFYTALGHTAESYTEPLFLQHLLGGIEYATGAR